MGAKKEKQESLKTTSTQLDDRLKPVHKMLKEMWSQHFCIFREKKA